MNPKTNVDHGAVNVKEAKVESDLGVGAESARQTGETRIEKKKMRGAESETMTKRAMAGKRIQIDPGSVQKNAKEVRRGRTERTDDTEKTENCARKGDTAEVGAKTGNLERVEALAEMLVGEVEAKKSLTGKRRS